MSISLKRKIDRQLSVFEWFEMPMEQVLERIEENFTYSELVVVGLYLASLYEKEEEE